MTRRNHNGPGRPIGATQRLAAALSLTATILVWLVAFIPACLYVALASAWSTLSPPLRRAEARPPRGLAKAPGDQPVARQFR
jgi:hypothetical protein